MTTLRVVVVNGSPSPHSKTMGLSDVILATLAEMLPVDASRIDVYRLGPGFTGAIERDDVTPEVEEALRRAEQADLLIAAAPVFSGSYPGMFKHFFDLVDKYALANKLVLLAATGGSEHHALVLEHALRPLFGFFQAMTIPVAIYASSGDFDGTVLLSPRVHGRIQMALTDVADLLKGRASGATEPAATHPGTLAVPDRVAAADREARDLPGRKGAREATPSPTSAAMAPNQPAPSPARRTPLPGTGSGRGRLTMGGDQGAVGEGDAQVLGLHAAAGNVQAVRVGYRGERIYRFRHRWRPHQAGARSPAAVMAAGAAVRRDYFTG